MFNERLNVRTRSIVTAGAVMALSGVTPEIIRRPGSDPVFEFPPETEPALQLFLRSKARLDRLVEEGA
jgi:hypothetical protein